MVFGCLIVWCGQIASRCVTTGAKNTQGRTSAPEHASHAVTDANVFHQEHMGTGKNVASATLI